MTYANAEILSDGNLSLPRGTRLISGNCPNCGAVIACINYRGSWPMLRCPCGWEGDTHAPLNKVRIETDPTAIYRVKA